MVQIVQGKQKESFGNQIMQGFANIGNEQNRLYEQGKQKENMNKLGLQYGIEGLGNYSPEIQKELLSKSAQGKNDQMKLNAKEKFLERLTKQQNGPNQSNVNELDMDEDNMGESPSSEKSGFNPLKWSDKDILEAENLGIKGLRESKDAELKRMADQRKEKQTKFQSDREYHSKIAQPVVNEAQEIVKNAPIKQGLIDQQRRDIASGETEGIIPFLIESTGFEPYRNPESARFKTASKQRFVESIHQLAGSNARPNQFIEQQLVAAQPTLGRSKESNETVLDMEQFVEDMKLKRAEVELQLAEEDNNKYGYPRNDIALRANKLMGDYAEKRQDEMAYDIRSRKENNMSDEQLANEMASGTVTPDTPLTKRGAYFLMIKNNFDERKAQSEAKSLGFKLPLESTYMR